MQLLELQQLLENSKTTLDFHLQEEKITLKSIFIEQISKNSNAYVDIQDMYHAEEQVVIKVTLKKNNHKSLTTVELNHKLKTAKAQLRLSPYSRVVVEVAHTDTKRYLLEYTSLGFVLLRPNTSNVKQSNNTMTSYYRANSMQNVSFNFSSAGGV